MANEPGTKKKDDRFRHRKHGTLHSLTDFQSKHSPGRKMFYMTNVEASEVDRVHHKCRRSEETGTRMKSCRFDHGITYNSQHVSLFEADSDGIRDPPMCKPGHAKLPHTDTQSKG